MFGNLGGTRKAWLFLLPVAALYLIAFLAPMGLVFFNSVSLTTAGKTAIDPSLTNFRTILTDGVTLKLLWRTFILSAIVTACCSVIAYPVALQMRRSKKAMRVILLALVVAPLLTSVIVRNVAWLLVLGRNGLINSTLLKLGLVETPLPLMYNTFGVVVAVVHCYLAFLILPVYSALLRIDPRVEESAASLGASPTSVFWRITFPLSLHGLVAGVSLVFILSMGLYLTPIIMGGSFVVTTSMMITELARNQYNFPMASAVSVLLLLAIAAVLVVTSIVGRRVEKIHA